MTASRLLASAAMVALLAGGALGQETRGPFQVPTRQSEKADAPAGPTLSLYPKSYALVIGIDDYNAGWGKLGGAIEDARAVAAALRARGFETELVLDADRAALENAFESFFIEKGADRNARLLVWYAGHGYSREREGYLVPRDAPSPSAGTAFFRKALSMRRFGEWARAANAKHVLAVFDSCFAGTIFQTARGTPPAAITAAVAEPVRQFLTSGDAGQEVSDDGRFRELFLAALDGKEARADANGDGYLTGTELGFFLADRLTNLTNRQQTPRYGKLQDEAYDRGDFVLAALAKAEAPKPPSTSPSPPPVATPSFDARQIELAFWNAIERSRNPADFEAYLQQYPQGAFVPIARNRLAELKLAALPQPEPTKPAPPPVPVASTPEAIEAELKLTKDDRALVQKSLSALGFDPRGSDGSLGPRSRSAISSWQAGKGELVTGYLTAQQHGRLLADAAPKLAALVPPKIEVPKPSVQPVVGVFEQPSPALAPGKVFRDCAECPEMVVVPAGSFTMGSPVTEQGRSADEGPQRRVTIGKSFAVGKYEVTFAEWDACVTDGGCIHIPADAGWGRGRRPVMNVSWNDVTQQYLPWLSLKTGQRYRLLSEAEWEYAARAGTTTAYSWGLAFESSKANNNGSRTVEVGSFAGNAFGLFDMHGNVWEWVEDGYQSSYSDNPTAGPVRVSRQGSWRVVRGGSWYYFPKFLRSAFRFRSAPEDRNNSTGFRVARTLVP